MSLTFPPSAPLGNLLSAMKVAIIDDSQFMRKLISTAVAHLHPEARLTEFPDATTALRRLGRMKPDLVTLDLLMPNLDGFGFLEKLARGGHRPRIVVITANVQDTVRRRCLELGVQGFIEKPVTLEKLRAALSAGAKP